MLFKTLFILLLKLALLSFVVTPVHASELAPPGFTSHTKNNEPGLNGDGFNGNGFNDDDLNGDTPSETPSNAASTNKPQEIYQWVDKNGNPAFGDKPERQEKAEILNINPTTTLSFPKNQPTTSSTSNVSDTPATAYTEFSITSPSNDDTIRSNEGNVSIVLSLAPALKAGHMVQIYLDGEAYGEAQTSLSITLSNIDRGSHAVNAEIQNSEGAALISSPEHTFHLRRFQTR